jgi:ubiquinone/menaquinone biosynthesis C-methylase UbiE
MLPGETHDEVARQEFVTSYKVHVLTQLQPGNKTVFERRAMQTYARAHGHAPRSRREVTDAMHSDPFWKTWSSLNRTSQELMWDALTERTGRQLDELNARAAAIAGGKKKLGSLRLNPELEIPRYNSEIHIHCQPGGYHTEIAKQDVFAGALYDLGAYQYGMGGQGPMTNDVGLTAVKYLKENHPKFAPRKILDLGCGVGHQTLALVDGFPDAEVYACDVGAPMVRYGHARAEALGKRVHFSQQNAEHTDFADQSFDLVTSLILFHETSYKAIHNVIKECYRVLKPGGMMVHGDVPEFNQFWPDPYDQFQRDWTTHFNAEPFRAKMRDMDMSDIAAGVGFNKKSIVETRLRSPFASPLYAKTHAYGALWWVMAAQK